MVKFKGQILTTPSYAFYPKNGGVFNIIESITLNTVTVSVKLCIELYNHIVSDNLKTFYATN